MNAIFPYRLYYLRKEHKETQEELARLFGVKRATISAYEKGKITPPYDKVAELAHHFGVTADYLLGNSDQRKAPENTPSEKPTVDVMDSLRTLKSDARDRNKDCYMNGRKLSENDRENVAVVLDSIIRIVEKMS